MTTQTGAVQDDAQAAISRLHVRVAGPGRGAFAGFVATVDQIAPDQRVWVLLDLMGRKSRVSIASNRLRKT
ncbi:MAG: hypothetical protein AAFN94_09155 [Pseudomonadota bacterium]